MSDRTAKVSQLVTTVVPRGWQQQAEGEFTFVTAGSDHAPRVRVQVAATAAEPIERAALRALTEVRGGAPDSVVVACDVWPHPVWGIGRLIQSARVHDGQMAAHDLYLFIEGEQRITFQVDCLLSDLLAIEEDVATIVASTRPAGAEQEMTMDATDAPLRRDTGFPERGSEDLSEVQRRPDRGIGTFRLRAGAVRHLLQPSGLEGWTDERRADRETLVSQGWTTRDGDPTAEAGVLHQELRAHGDVLHLTAADTRGVVRGWIHCGAERAVVIIDPLRHYAHDLPSPVSSEADAPEPTDEVVVDVVQLAAIPVLLARWGGLAPTWTVTDPLTPVGARAIQRRVLDAQEPPPADTHAELADVWERPWTWWSVATADRQVDLQFIHAGDRGQYVSHDRQDGDALLVPRPGTLVWGDLQQVCGRSSSRSGGDW